MSEPIKTKPDLRPVHPIGHKILGAFLVAIGSVLMVAIAFPYVGIFIAAPGAVLAFVGVGMFSYGCKADENPRPGEHGNPPKSGH